MVKIVIEISSSRHVRKEIRHFDAPEIRIGRGYQNDLIIQDPYVSAEHLMIRQTEDGWIVKDQQSRNGVFLYNKKARSRNRKRLEEPHHLNSGDIFFIGNTVIRIFLPEHKVAPAKRMESKGLVLRTLNNRTSRIYAFVGFFLLYYIDLLLTHPYLEKANGQIIFIELVIYVTMMVWSGIWALVGRMIRQKGRFLWHLTLVSIFMIIMIPISNISQFLGFLFASSVVESGIMIFFGGTAFAMLLISHEAIATFLSLRARIIFSALVPITIGVLSLVGYLAWQSEFQPQPPHYVRLNPPIIQPFFVKTPEEFLQTIPDIIKDSQ